MNSTGADVPAAIRHIAEAGYTVAHIATDLGVARSTVYRWRAGRHQPTPANLDALTQRVDTWYSRQVHRRQLTVASVHLQDAADALITDVQRAQEDALAADIRAHLEAGQRRREAEAELRRSAYADVDPFALVATGQPAEQTLPF